MEKSPQANQENGGYAEGSVNKDSQKIKRKRMVRKSEVTVHQWTFSTEIK